MRKPFSPGPSHGHLGDPPVDKGKRRKKKTPRKRGHKQFQPQKKNLGTAHNRVAKTGLITVKIDTSQWKKPPRLGLKVYSDQRPVGRIVDVIGPVESPFAVVKLEDGAEVQEGESLYVEAPSRGKPRGDRPSRKPASRGGKPRRKKTSGRDVKGRRRPGGRGRRS